MRCVCPEPTKTLISIVYRVEREVCRETVHGVEVIPPAYDVQPNEVIQKGNPEQHSLSVLGIVFNASVWRIYPVFASF